MLTLRILPRNINQFLKQSSQQLHTSVKLLSSKNSSSSSSSSSDSSDSDSDRENSKFKKTENVQTKVDSDQIPSTTARLESLLNMMSVNTNKDKFNVSSKPKRLKKKQTNKQANKQDFATLLSSAAKDVAETIPGDAKENELELLSKVLNLKPPDRKGKGINAEESAPATVPDLSYLVTGMKVEQPIQVNSLKDMRKSAVKKVQERFQEPSISQSILYAKSVKYSKIKPDNKAELNAVNKPLGIFKNEPDDPKRDVPSLATWEAMEIKEMKLAILTSPRNVFEELILWTDHGKLWHFPINNEQGMEEEEKVHFSEHVFLERHLKGWCPRRGPIRHFMELVCTGLSKNPYMTVQEKVGHITWYRNYFEDKKALLHELGVLDDIKIPSLETQKKKEIEA